MKNKISISITDLLQNKFCNNFIIPYINIYAYNFKFFKSFINK